MTLLRAKELSRNFGGLVALERVNAEVHPGEIVGLIGPNGSGKTTLFNVINGQLSPHGGSVHFEGRRIDGLQPYQITRLGIGRTFQVVKPLGRLTVRENVLAAAWAKGGSRAKALAQADRLLEMTGLAGRADDPAASLTLAGKKRLELARALATGPKLLLLDEIFAGLTPAECEQTVTIIRKLRDEGITVLFIEHLMRVVMSLSDRVIVLHEGKKLAEGTPAQVASHPPVIEAYLGPEHAQD